MPEEFDEFDSVDSNVVLHGMIEAAITIGAPVYNAGDPRGCYDIYAATARMLLKILDAGSMPSQQLSAALQSASLELDCDEQSWILRRAFDKILGEETEGEASFHHLN